MSFKFFEKSATEYWKISIVLPKFKTGKVTFEEDYDSSISDGRKYSVAFNTEMGYYEDDHFRSIWLVILGFGCALAVQDGY